MTKYKYTALNREGNRIEGVKEAASKNEVIDFIINQGMSIISIREEFGINFKDFLKVEIGGLNLAERVIFSKQLATMISAGIPIIQAIDILKQQAEKDKLKRLMANVYKSIEGGSSLATSFRQNPGIFSDVQLNLIDAGEKSGNLNTMLIKVAEDMEKSKQIKGKIVGALIYPAIIFVVLIVVVMVMIVFMVPQVKELYASLGKNELPFITNILIGIASALTNPLALIFMGIIIVSVFVSYKFYISKPSGRMVVDKIKLNMPVFGNLITKVQLSEFCRITSMLMQSGIPIIQSTDIVANALSNSVFSKVLRDAKEEVIKGSSLSLAMAKSNIADAYPIILLKIISVGEESGKVDKVLDDMYKYYDNEVEQVTTNLTKLLEPIILVVVGLMVAFLAIAIYLPIYQVGDFVQ